MGTEKETNVIINNIGYVHFACSEEELSCRNVNRFVSVNCLVQRKRSNGNLVFIFNLSNRHEQVLRKNIYDF